MFGTVMRLFVFLVVFGGAWYVFSVRNWFGMGEGKTRQGLRRETLWVSLVATAFYGLLQWVFSFAL